MRSDCLVTTKRQFLIPATKDVAGVAARSAMMPFVKTVKPSARTNEHGTTLDPASEMLED